jgi:hypothetical protein
MNTSANDPWAAYKNKRGEFKRWLRTWVYTGDNQRGFWSPFGPLPWVLPADQPLSGEALTAMFHVGVTARWPGEWKHFDPDLLWMRKNTCYGIILNGSSVSALSAHVQTIRRQCLNQEEFDQILRKYILFPKRKEIIE